MAEQWHAQINVTDAIVKNCLEDQFHSLLPLQQIECVGEGWDNKVYLINKKVIFRFPRREIAVDLIERENAILTPLQAISNLEIPNPIYRGKITSLYPYPFHGYNMISGVSGCQASLTEQERLASLKPLTEFLKRLHSIDGTNAINMGAKPQVYDRTNTAVTIAALNERVTKIIDRHICRINKAVYKNEMKSAAQITLPQTQCLIHGDLYCRHLLFNHGHLTGIIDWGDVGINNRSVDLAVIWSFYPQKCHQEFFENYGMIDSATWQYARFLAIHSALTVLLYGFDVSNLFLVNEALSSLKRINPDLIIPE